ncbi:aminoacylase-1-like [Planococcus citri]|uniref:aminoacylase-1-like n=1 Tax=Planococcus citri TaxID=170843 RepID=UPI0031F7C853
MEKEHPAVTNFRNYLRIPTVHPDINYDECVKFLIGLADELKLPHNVIEVKTGKPVVVITWQGSEPDLPSILLNSHMDVVPVFPDNWTYGPFDAVKDANGDIYARGAQDMKCVGIQYMETIRKYLNEGLKFRRTIHLSFVPDEEIGGVEGMGYFVERPEFKKLNVGFTLDEGIASPSDEFLVFYAERSIWQIIFTCCGNAGHGSLLHENTAAEKVQYLINKFFEYREQQKKKLHSDPNLLIGDVTTVNLTKLEGGVQMNVVPPEMKIGFDIRLALDVNHEDFVKMIDTWCQEAGKDIQYEFINKMPYVPPTILDDSNPWWVTFKNEADKMGLKLRKAVFPGGTDCRYVRELGIPAFGFSPMNNTPVLLHDHDEFLNENVFLKGLDIYYNIIKSAASL